MAERPNNIEIKSTEGAMLYLVSGRAGSGKSTYIYGQIEQSIKKGNKVFFITPQQNAVHAERHLTEMLSGANSADLEVLNFSRLTNHVARKYGNLSYRLIGKGAKRVILWRTMSSILPSLSGFADVDITDVVLLDKILDMILEFKMYNISPEMLRCCAEGLPEGNESLRAKLLDIATIFAANDAILHSCYDDPADELTQLAHTLRENDYFGGTEVYFDGFGGFTPQQFSVFYEILRQADKVTVSVPYPGDDSEDVFFGVCEFYRKLIGSANKLGVKVAPPFHLNSNLRAQNEELVMLEESVYRHFDEEFIPSEQEPEHVVLCEFTTPFDEVQSIASDISKKVRDGAKYRDFAVAIRDAERYSGIIDAVFEKYGIPFFFSRREDICSKPLMQLVFSALSVYEHHFRRSDVLSYIKTGLCGVSDEDCGIFENYLTMWNVSGRRFASEYDFNMNPDGYTDKWSDYGKEQLSRINEVRRYILDSLDVMFRVFESGNATVTDICASLVRYLESLGLGERLYAAEEFAGQDHILAAREFSAVWDLLMSSLDELVFAAGDMKCGCAEFVRILKALVSDADIGKIPKSHDEVVIAEAQLFRSHEIKKLYVPGVSEGHFPHAVSQSGLLEEHERAVLLDAGMELSADTETLIKEEMYCFYRTVTVPRNELWISYSRFALDGTLQRPSSAFEEIRRIFPKIKIEEPTISPLDGLCSMQSAFETAVEHKGDLFAKAICDFYADDDQFATKMLLADLDVTEIKSKLSPDTVKMLFGSDLSLSYSRLESFSNCRLAFYLTYILKLKEQKKNEIGTNHIGTFLHQVFEKFLCAFCDAEKRKAVYGDDGEKLPSYIRSLTEEYINTVFGQGEAEGKLLTLAKRLESAALVVTKNLSREFEMSKFIPAAFEYKIGGIVGEEGAKIELDDGSTVNISGVIDRIDTYQKDGKTYVRVVDYKTGSTTFDIEKIKKGRGMQLFLYLSALCRAEHSAFGDELVPAGVLYMHSRPPRLKLDGEPEFFDVCAGSDKSMQRSGLVLSDAEILRAMEPALEGKFLPVSLKKDGEFNKRQLKNMASEEDFYALMEDVRDSAKKIAEDIKSGNADAIGIQKAEDGKMRACRPVCDYCPMKPVCRNL